MAARKTGTEAKVERLTWFAIVIIFLFMSNNDFDGAVMLGTISAILLLSGVYQWRRRWSVGPAVFIAAGIGGIVSLYSLWQPLPVDLSLASFVLIIFVIVVGIITNDS